MGDSHNGKPGARPGSSPSPTKPAADANAASAGGIRAETLSNQAGRVVHDERGNAVWDWLKDTARIAVDSTSRLLRRLEVPELKIEDTHEQEFRAEADRDCGGGYDPYGVSIPTPGRTSGAQGSGRSDGSRGSATNAGATGGNTKNTGRSYDPHGGSSPTLGRPGTARVAGGAPGTSSVRGDPTSNMGGGYDPYGKGVTNKPPRKP
jgi:hypothetical protein